MWILVTLLPLMVLPLIQGEATELTYKGCFSTSFVQNYAFYYKINQSLPFEECLAACNNRITRFMGIQKHLGIPTYNFVYCGNDLPDVSPKAEHSNCLENDGRFYGENDTMAVYMLRDSTPMAILLATNQGVELLIDNKTTLIVNHFNNSDYKSVDYIYTEDLILSLIDFSVLRSPYNYPLMKYVTYNDFSSNSSLRSLGVDFISRTLYYSHWLSDIIYGFHWSILSNYILAVPSGFPAYLSVDPYSSLVFFLEYTLPFVNSYSLSTGRRKKVTTNHFHVQNIKALSIDYQLKILYAITTFTGDSTNCLVSWDYDVTQMQVLYSGAELQTFDEGYSSFDVYNETVIWISRHPSTYMIYKCKLTPRCTSEHVSNIFTLDANIYSMKIYHPERQTPGKKQLCANMTCEHECKAFSPFSARCSCPPFMELDPYNNRTCKVLPTTPPHPQTSTEYWYNSTSSTSTVKSVFVTPTLDIKTTVKDNGCKEKNSLGLYYATVTNIVYFVILVVIVISIVKLYRKPTQEPIVAWHKQEAPECCNIYDTLSHDK